MAFVLRWFNLVFILVFWVLALVATLPMIPLYRLDLNGVLDQQGSVDVSLWEIKTTEITMDVAGTEQQVKVPSEDPIRINFLNCTEQRSRFRAMEAFSIAGTVFGFYAFLLCFVMCACCRKVKLPVFLFLILAFVSELVLVILTAVVYTKEACVGQLNFFQSFKESGYKFAVGFILQIVSCAGYLICMIITPFTQELWCGGC